MIKIFYAILEHCDESITPGDLILMNLYFLGETSEMAEWAAKDYHQRHDGWEAAWPLTFVLFDENEKEIGRYLVDREVEPIFRAVKSGEGKGENGKL